MDEEIRCFLCKNLFENPVLLPCYHALCLNCAFSLQVSANNQNLNQNESESVKSSNSDSSVEYQEVDKLSILSETDSGVVCSSRPNSYVGSPNLGYFLSLKCPICSKIVYFDENGALNLPKYKVMAKIIEKFNSKNEKNDRKCQMCDQNYSKIFCENCEIFYCDECKETLHPMRGPLAKHNLISPPYKPNRTEITDQKCHFDSLEVQTICKNQKTELSKNLQKLSEKARSTTEFIQRLKGMSEKINENCQEFETLVSTQCDFLIEQLQKRKRELIDSIQRDKELKVKNLKEQVQTCTFKLQKTTGLIQFCIEALKETDNLSFLQVGQMLNQRVMGEREAEWGGGGGFSGDHRITPHFDLTLDDSQVIRAIQQLNFIQMKPPTAPTIIPDECSAENNSVTVAWQPPTHSHVEGYVLELDDGQNGDFREVYCGIETICTIDGLHFNSMYNARVKAYNSSGEGDYSELIGLQTAEVAWFSWDPILTGPGLNFSQDGMSVSGEGWDHRVALGSVGFSRGVHYWEISIDKFDADTDPAFGVARIDVARDKMLGKDDKGWSMYIDHKRSWFQHGGCHEQRVEGGVDSGGTIGVLLDLENHVLQFYVNDEQQGTFAFRNLYGVFYPAVSVNRGVSLTLHTALDPPQLDT